MAGKPRVVDNAIKVEGLTEFRKGLKNLDASLPKALRVALNRAVALVVDDAKPKVPRRSGRARNSVKAQSTQSQARIKAGGNRAPYFGWLDFGGVRVGRGGGRAKREFEKQGRYVWKSFSDKRDEVVGGVEAAVRDVGRQAGLEVTSNG